MTDDPSQPINRDEGFDGEVFVWHDHFHEVIDSCRLSFWRLAFVPDYPRREIFQTLAEFYSEYNIASHIAYETLGEFDLLLRLWIPRVHTPDDIEDVLRERLKLYNVRYLAVRHYAHWSGDAPTPSRQALESIDDRVVVAINEHNAREAARYDAWLARSDIGTTTAASRDLVETESPRQAWPDGARDLVEQELLTPIPLDTRGVRFFVTFDKPNVPFRPEERDDALSEVRRLCKSVREQWAQRGVLPQLSLYDGSGTMNEFLVLARAPHGHFHRFTRDLVLGLRGIGLDRRFHMRPYTHVIADEMFSEFREYRPPRFQGTAQLVEEDFLKDESDSWEYKATFAIDFRTLVTAGRRDDKRERKEDVVKAVCGLLNSESGGTLILGVLEVRREITGYARPVLLLDFLRREFGYEWPDGAEDPSNHAQLPSLIVGIEQELVENGGPVKDVESFSNDVIQVLLDWITPPAGPYFQVETQHVGERTVCVVSVRPSAAWHYTHLSADDPGTFFVRQGASTRRYNGYQADLYKQAVAPRLETARNPRAPKSRRDQTADGAAPGRSAHPGNRSGPATGARRVVPRGPGQLARGHLRARRTLPVRR